MSYIDYILILMHFTLIFKRGVMFSPYCILDFMYVQIKTNPILNEICMAQKLMSQFC